MKTYVICFSDPNGILYAQTIEIHATSFPDAYLKAVDYQGCFVGLVLTSITLVLDISWKQHSRKERRAERPTTTGK